MFIFVALFSVDGNLLYANKTPFVAAQVKPSEAIGKPVWETQLCNHSVAVQEQLRAAFRRVAAGETMRFDVPVRVAGGNMITVDGTLCPLFGPDGNVREIVGSAVDITQRKQAEEQSQRRQHELAHVLRVATMGEMATGIAHELSQPLGAITTYAHAALRGLNLPESDPQRTQRLLRQIEEQGFRAGEIVRRLRQLVNKTQPHRSSVQLNEAIGDVMRLLEHESRLGGVRFDFGLDESLPEVLCDRIQIQQVLLNLVRNALEALADVPLDRRGIRIGTSREGRHVMVVLSDSGPGISPEHQDQIFEAFFTTKPAGLGMGLPICRSIIEAHGGGIEFTPTPAGGATFSILVPIHDSPDNRD